MKLFSFLLRQPASLYVALSLVLIPWSCHRQTGGLYLPVLPSHRTLRTSFPDNPTSRVNVGCTQQDAPSYLVPAPSRATHQHSAARDSVASTSLRRAKNSL